MNEEYTIQIKQDMKWLVNQFIEETKETRGQGMDEFGYLQSTPHLHRLY